MKKLLSLVFTLGIICAGFTTVSATNVDITIKAATIGDMNYQIVDERGEVLTNVSVTVKDPTGVVIYDEVSKDGDLFIADLPFGDYIVTLEKDGYELTEITVTINLESVKKQHEKQNLVLKDIKEDIGSSVKTGDNSNYTTYGILFALSGIAIIGYCLLNKERRKD